MASQNTVTLTNENFPAEVLKSATPVLVDFWAEWCGPCKMIAPALDELAEEFAGKLKVAKLNVDNDQALAAQYRVNSIPTFLLFKNGEVVAQQVGIAGGKAKLKSLISSVAG